MTERQRPLFSSAEDLEYQAQAAMQELSAVFDSLDPRSQAGAAVAVAIERFASLLRGARSLISRYRGVLNAAPDAIQLIDRMGNIVDVNHTACTMYGRRFEEMIGLNVTDLNPATTVEDVRQAWARLTVGQTDSVETTNQRSNGQVFPVEVRTNAFQEGNQKLLVALVRDTSERHAQEAERRRTQLSEHQARVDLQALIEAVDKGLIVAQPRGGLRSVNPAALRLLRGGGLPLRQFSSSVRRQWDLFDSNGKVLAWSALFNPKRWPKDARSVVVGLRHHSTSRLIWLSLTVVPQHHDDGALRQVIALFSDVTELKRAAESFEEVQRLGHIGTFEINFAAGESIWSEETHRLFESDARTAQQKFWAGHDLVHPDDLALVAAHLQRARLGESVRVDFRLKLSSGSTRWLSMHARPAVGHALEHQNVQGSLQDITDRQREQERWRLLAVRDPLTGLLNRTAFIDLANASARAGAPFAILYLDLDHFKVVNDLLGSEAGDRILMLAAKRFESGLLAAQAVARWSGDEFLALLGSAQSDIDALEGLATRLGAIFEDSFVVDGEAFRLSPSIGIAVYPEHGANAQALIRRAESAMLEAKRRGRNTFHFYHGGLGHEHDQRTLIEMHMRRALENNELDLVYLPKLDVQTQRLVGVEALLRWNCKALGLVPTDKFIPFAEATGDIVPIGAWVVRRALADLREWRLHGLDIETMAINVSHRQLISPGFTRMVRDALNENGITADSLEFEFTERVMIEDSPETLNTLGDLRRLGASLSIDDFGEGYSALGYLRTLPVQGLKISHNLMKAVPHAAVDTHLCEAIIALARRLDLSVTIEGVERHDQLAFVKAHGAHYAQGFLFSYPLSSIDLLARYGPS